MKKNRIAILLPFKDHYTHLKAGSASIWVKDFNKKSIYKNQITVFGNTDNLDDVIDKNIYTNISLRNIKIGSKNIAYVEEFIKHDAKNKFNIIVPNINYLYKQKNLTVIGFWELMQTWFWSRTGIN